jgi:hypothetical protein
MIRYLNNSRNTIKNCYILSFKGMLIGTHANMVEALGYKPEGRRALFPVRPLDFSVYAILPAAVWTWGRKPLADTSTTNLPGATRHSGKSAINPRLVNFCNKLIFTVKGC